MLESKQKGIVTELQCITAFNELGYHISIPYGENSRYDFIADINGKLIRVQVKSSSYKTDTSFNFSCRSSHTNAKGTQNIRYTSEEIDYFCTYFNGKCYLISVNECSTEKTLHYEPPKSGQIKGIAFAENYELSNQIEKIIGGSN